MMKKLLILAAAALTVALSGCALMPNKPENTPAPTAEPSAEVSAEPSLAPEQTPAPEPTPEPTAAPTPAEAGEAGVIEAFEKMNEFRMFWYGGGNSSAASGDQFTVEEMPCSVYETEDVKTFDDLKALALTMVSEELFEEFQSSFTYFDKDGALCGPVSYGAGDNSDFVGNECESVKISDTEYELKVGQYYNIEALSGDELKEKSTLVGEFTCRYGLADGKWVFTSLSYERKDIAAG